LQILQCFRKEPIFGRKYSEGSDDLFVSASPSKSPTKAEEDEQEDEKEDGDDEDDEEKEDDEEDEEASLRSDRRGEPIESTSISKRTVTAVSPLKPCTSPPRKAHFCVLGPWSWI
jgi:hypothetical protein